MLTKAVREEPTSHHLHMQSEALGARPAAAGFVEEGGLDRFGGFHVGRLRRRGSGVMKCSRFADRRDKCCGQTGE